MSVLCFNSLGMQISALSETVFHNLRKIKGGVPHASTGFEEFLILDLFWVSRWPQVVVMNFDFIQCSCSY